MSTLCLIVENIHRSSWTAAKWLLCIKVSCRARELSSTRHHIPTKLSMKGRECVRGTRLQWRVWCRWVSFSVVLGLLGYNEFRLAAQLTTMQTQRWGAALASRLEKMARYQEVRIGSPGLSGKQEMLLQRFPLTQRSQLECPWAMHRTPNCSGVCPKRD